MRDNTFTPGPWNVNGQKSIRGKNKEYIANANWKNGANNARLIAAAPDMYDALWETIELSDRNLTEAGRTPECQRVYDIVRAALRKAEGE